MVKSAIDC